MNIKRVLAGSLSAITVGATLAFGAFAATSGLGTYVSTASGALTSPILVVGDSVPGSDVIGAADIAAAVAGYATTPMSVAGASGTVSVSNGVGLDTSNTKLYLADDVNTARSTLTKNDLPTILASSETSDTQGTTYRYDQYIFLGNRNFSFSNSGSDLTDPILIIDAGTDGGAASVYNTTAVFTKPINISIGTAAGTSVKGKSIQLFGNTYTVGSDSTATKLILFGGANTITMAEGEERTLSVDSVDHTAKVIGVSSATQVVLEVDGVSDTFDKGASKTISGSKGKVDVYIDNLFFFSKTGTISSAKLSLGSSKLTMENGQRVKVGTQDTPIDGTFVTLVGTPLSQLTVAVAAQKSQTDHISESLSLTDPVFKSFKVAFGGSVPALTSAERHAITLSAAGDRLGQVTMTDGRGNSKNVVIAYDSDTSTSTVTPTLADSNGKAIHVIEGDQVSKNEYVILSQGDFSRMLQVTDINNVADTAAADGSVTLTDVFDGSTVKVSLEAGGYTNATNFYLDGQQYFVNASGSGSGARAVFTWGTSAAVLNNGSARTVFPQLIGKHGEGIVFLGNQTNLTIPMNTTIELPGGGVGTTLATTSTALALGNPTTRSQTITAGRLDYIVNFSTSNATASISYVCGTGVTALSSCINLSDGYPAVIVIEEKGKNLAGTEVRDAILAEFTSSGTSTVKMGVSTTVRFSDTSGAASFVALSSNSNKQSAVDRYGTAVTTDSTNQGEVKVWYPDVQAIMAAGIGENPTFSSGGAGGTVDTALKITKPLAKFAAEVNTASLTSDLILVGGPCANSLVATLMANANESVSCSNWNLSKGLIKEYANAFGSGRKALVVAGTNAADTRALAADVMAGTLSFQQ